MLITRLLETAIDQFGHHGFDGASTRRIARESATAMSSITYHFGGKEGLYLAAADHIAAQIKQRNAPVLAAASAQLETLDAQAALARLLPIFDHFAEMMFHPDSESWARFIVREQQAPTEAFERLYRGMMRDMVDTVLRLLAIIRADLCDAERRAMAVILYGQILIMRTGRASVSKILGVEEIGETEMDLLRTALRKTAMSILTRDTA